MSWWTREKLWLSEVLALPDEVLHIFAGLAILVVVAAVVRRTPWHWLPWSAVLLIELANEAYDLAQPSELTGEGNLARSWHDLWITMFWPTVILLGFGWLARRGELRGRRRRAVHTPE